MNAKKALGENGDEHKTEARISLTRRAGIWRVVGRVFVDAEITNWGKAKIAGCFTLGSYGIWKLMQLIGEVQQ